MGNFLFENERLGAEIFENVNIREFSGCSLR